MNYLKRAVISIIGVLCLVGLDQWTKALAIEHLSNGTVIQLWPEVFELQYLENHGMAFGLFQNQQTLFIIVTIIILIVVAYFWWKTPDTKRFLPLQIIMVLIVAGAVGNCIDRVTHGYVVDFFYFRLINFPIFNVADIYVTVACVLALIFLFFVYGDEELTNAYGRKKKEIQ